MAVEHPRPGLNAGAKVGVHLERLSMGEVALVTGGPLRWEARTIARTARSTTIRFEPRAVAPVTLLNAARVQGLAARTRQYLAARGFRGSTIGDAPAVRQHSVILYLAADRARAERIAAQFGFALQRQPDTGARGARGMTILLGRDAARDEALARRRA